MGNNLKLQLDRKEERLHRLWQEYAEPMERHDNRPNHGHGTREFGETHLGDFDTHPLMVYESPTFIPTLKSSAYLEGNLLG